MLGLQLRVNNTTLISNVQAIRTAPKGDVKDGDECTYLARIYNQDCGTIHHPYGDPSGLAKKMLDMYDSFTDKKILEFKIKNLERTVEEITK